MQYPKVTPIKESNFSDFFNLAKKLQREIRKQVCFACGWSEATFYRKIKSSKPLREDELLAIANVCNKLIGKMINTIVQPTYSK